MVRYFIKDTKGAYEALGHAERAAQTCKELLDGGIPYREIVELEVLRGTLVRFKSDLMLTEGKVDPAIELQSQSLVNLTQALNKYPGNTDIQTAYNNCSSRLQAVLVEQGQGLRAKEVAQAWLQLAQSIQQADPINPKAREFLSLAYHSMGHLNEKTMQKAEAERCYREALATANSLLSITPSSESLLNQVLELNVHLIKSELSSGHLPLAQSRFGEAIQIAGRLKSLPDGNELYRSSIERQMQAALRFLQESDYKESKEGWNDQLRESGLLP